MTFDEWLDQEIPGSKGYLTKEPMTRRDLISHLSRHSETMLGGPIEVMRLLEDAYLAGRFHKDSK